MRDKNKILVITICGVGKAYEMKKGTAREIFSLSTRHKHFWKMMDRLGTKKFEWAIVSKYGLWFWDEVHPTYDTHPKKYMNAKWRENIKRQLEGWKHVFYYDPYIGAPRSAKFQWKILHKFRPDMRVGKFDVLIWLCNNEWKE